mmetsp:Transcript_34368/g.95010  ORF Transcript_34368/g.95010 Transcript_34368/m.95010 type:complete len:220 (+) Transcript_34368:212-871(+)
MDPEGLSSKRLRLKQPLAALLEAEHGAHCHQKGQPTTCCSDLQDVRCTCTGRCLRIRLQSRCLWTLAIVAELAVECALRGLALALALHTLRMAPRVAWQEPTSANGILTARLVEHRGQWHVAVLDQDFCSVKIEVLILDLIVDDYAVTLQVCTEEEHLAAVDHVLVEADDKWIRCTLVLWRLPLQDDAIVPPQDGNLLVKLGAKFSHLPNESLSEAVAY